MTICSGQCHRAANGADNLLAWPKLAVCSAFCHAGCQHTWPVHSVLSFVHVASPPCTLACRLKGTKVTPLAVHPGVVETPLWRHLWARSGCFAGLFALARRSSIFGIKTPAQAREHGSLNGLLARACSFDGADVT